MTFTVGWEPGVRLDLAWFWATAIDPPAVWMADDEAQLRLARDPFAAGRPTSEGLWRVEIPPIVFFYSIDPVRRHVSISAVGRLADPPPPEPTP